MARLRSVAVLIIVGILLMVTTHGYASAAGKRLALVIGNGDYAGRLQLPNAVGDADAIAATLESMGFEVTAGRNLKRAEFKRLLNIFSASAEDADEVVFYYGGHGFQYDGVNYLVPVDAKLKQRNSIPHENISLIDILDQINWSDGKSSGQKTVVLLDACRNDPLPANLREDGMPVGLAEMQKRPNTLIAFATQPGSLTNDGAAGAHSPFTAALLKYLDTAGLSVSIMMAHVMDEVSAATDGSQIPSYQSGIVGPLYLKPSSFVTDDTLEAETDSDSDGGIIIGTSKTTSKPTLPATAVKEDKNPKPAAAAADDQPTEKTAPKQKVGDGPTSITTAIPNDEQEYIGVAVPSDAQKPAEVAAAEPRESDDIGAATTTVTGEKPLSVASATPQYEPEPSAAIVPDGEKPSAVTANMPGEVRDSNVVTVVTSTAEKLSVVAKATPKEQQEVASAALASEKQASAVIARAGGGQEKAIAVAALDEDGEASAPASPAQDEIPSQSVGTAEPPLVPESSDSSDPSKEASIGLASDAPVMRSGDIAEVADAESGAMTRLSAGDSSMAERSGYATMAKPSSDAGPLRPVNEFEIAMTDPNEIGGTGSPVPSLTPGSGKLRDENADADVAGAVQVQLERLGCFDDSANGSEEQLSALALNRYAKAKGGLAQPVSRQLLDSLKAEDDDFCVDSDDVQASAATESGADEKSTQNSTGRAREGKRSSSARSRTKNSGSTTRQPATRVEAPKTKESRPKPAKSGPARVKQAPSAPAAKKKTPIIIW